MTWNQKKLTLMEELGAAMAALSEAIAAPGFSHLPTDAIAQYDVSQASSKVFSLLSDIADISKNYRVVDSPDPYSECPF